MQCGTRLLAIAEQLDRAGCAIICLQGTRHRVTPRLAGPYFVVGNPATPKGCEGVQIWFHAETPLTPQGQPLQRQHVRLLWSTPTTLIVRIHHPDLQCILVNTHAPHSGHGEEPLRQHWEQISAVLNKGNTMLPVIFAGDANAQLGATPNELIGDHGGEKENLAGICFADWLQRHRLWLPATFAETHHGPHETHWTPDGQHGHRLDYIGLSLHDRISHVMTHVMDYVDLTTQRVDVVLSPG